MLNCKGSRRKRPWLSFLGWGESLLGTSTINWPIVPYPDDRWWMWSGRWNENWQGKPKYSEKTCLSTTLSTTNSIWAYLGSNPGRRRGKPAAKRLRHGTADKRPWLNRGINQEFCRKVWGKPLQTSMRISAVLADVWTKDLPNLGPGYYTCIYLLSKVLLVVVTAW
jgi:hypothetical protein